MKTKFALRNFAGKPVRYFTVDSQTLASPPTKPRVGHHILVVDASGSMYGDIGDVKEKIRKMLTLDEYRDSEMLVSLLSYSSSGDLIEHFERVPVGDIVKSKNTKAQREIGSLKARGMTCMTQAFERAIKLAEEYGGNGELTAISIHTDGFFNDPSPTAEFRQIDQLIERAKKLRDTFVNTIGYRDWCDFKILDKIANALSGRCWRASGIKEFYDSIYDTTALLAGQSAPAVYLEKTGDFDYQVFVAQSAGSGCVSKIVGGAGDLSVSGVKADETKTVFRYKEVSFVQFSKSTLPENETSALLAFARAQLAEGRVNAAKYAVVTSRVVDLVENHARALTGPELAAFGEAIERAFWQTLRYSDEYGLADKRASVPAILELLAANRGDFLLNIKSFLAEYKRRGLKRVTGTWSGDKLIKPAVHTELREADTHVPVAGFDFNRNNATINMLVTQRCRLVRDDVEVRELAGIRLDLRDYKQYTLVGDGSTNVGSLEVRVTSKALHRKLIDLLGKDEVPAFDPKKSFAINLRGRPLVDYNTGFDSKRFAGLGRRLVTLHAADKLFGALIKGRDSELSKEQVEELKANCVTSSLYFSPPSANPYTDLKKAIAEGEVDVRLSYRVLVGEVELLDPSDLHSANEFVKRWYECTSGKTDDPKKATMQTRFEKNFAVKHKVLGPRVKVTEVDRLMARVFDAFFGLSADVRIFDECFGVALGGKLAKLCKRKQLGRDEVVATLEEAQRVVGEALDKLYREEVSPLVFYVGSSGLLPDDFGDLQALSSDQLVAKYTAASPSKAMRESGVHFDLGNGAIVTVLVEQEYFSTDRGIEAAKRLEEAA